MKGVSGKKGSLYLWYFLQLKSLLKKNQALIKHHMSPSSFLSSLTLPCNVPQFMNTTVLNRKDEDRINVTKTTEQADVLLLNRERP